MDGFKRRGLYEKIVLGSFTLFVVYAVLIWLYLFQWSDTSIPDALKGTSGDPATFMNERELVLAQEYSQIKDFLFFLSVPYEWLGFVLVLVLGFSRKFSKWAKDITKMSALQTAIYVFWLSCFYRCLRSRLIGLATNYRWPIILQRNLLQAG